MRSRAECDLTVVSIFVNPSQFSPHEDFGRYPRDLDRDLALSRSAAATSCLRRRSKKCIGQELRQRSMSVRWHEALEGADSPDAFPRRGDGRDEVVSTRAGRRAYFGQKDYQQTLVVRQMVADLDVPIEIRVCPTVREPDGLAMSSRNAYLSAAERRARFRCRRVCGWRRSLLPRAMHDVAAIRTKMEAYLREAGGVDLDYIAFVSDGTVSPVTAIMGPTVVVMAAKFGKTRLIDNLRIG